MALENDNKDSAKSNIITSPEGDKKSVNESPAVLKGFEKNSSNKRGSYVLSQRSIHLSLLNIAVRVRLYFNLKTTIVLLFF